MTNDSTNRLDFTDEEGRRGLLPFCRLQPGEVWSDPEGRHVIGCGDATDCEFVRKITASAKPTLAVQDPPYNMITGPKVPVDDYIDFSRKWIQATYNVLSQSSALYVWLGADQDNHYQPLPQFMAMMAESGFDSRSLLTMRNQRGYGTQKNWMAVRQELLYYTKGNPEFEVQYTDIPKILRGYYKDIGGERTENLKRGKSPNIRPGNVWVDVQQVFYRMEENVPGCHAQKPLMAIERIVRASSAENDTVLDCFGHSGTTMIACERTGRRCITFDLDPIFAEIMIRRLERFRATGKIGWQRENPFENELAPCRLSSCRSGCLQPDTVNDKASGSQGT